MNQVLSDEERSDLIDTVDWYNFPKDLIEATEQAVLSKFGGPIGYFDPKEKRFIYDTTHPQYYLRAYAMKETK